MMLGKLPCVVILAPAYLGGRNKLRAYIFFIYAKSPQSLKWSLCSCLRLNLIVFLKLLIFVSHLYQNAKPAHTKNKNYFIFKIYSLSKNFHIYTAKFYTFYFLQLFECIFLQHCLSLIYFFLNIFPYFYSEQSSSMTNFIV